MLLELKVTNFAIIENLHIQFQRGLNILSGETGAGKSVLLKSLSLLMGLKSSTESIRSGCTQASIEGSFDISNRKDIQNRLKELGVEAEEDLLVVKRVLSEDKSRVYLNGSLSTLNVLRDIVSPLIEVAGQAAPLIEMTGQHENRNLLSKAYHLDLLDQYAGVWEMRSQYSQQFAKLFDLKKQLEQFKKESAEKSQRLDFLLYQQDEIAKLNISLEKDQDLESRIQRLKNSSKLTEFIDLAELALVADDDSALMRLMTVIKRSTDLRQSDPKISELVEPLAQAKTLIDDSMYELRAYASKIDSNPQALDRLESRLSDIRKLQKKYGSEIESILAAFENMNIEIEKLNDSDSYIEKIESEITEIETGLMKTAKEMHKRRTKAATLLADSVNGELLDLNMKGVTFHVVCEVTDQLQSTGPSDVEFMSQTSSKDPKRPLAKFASGGELSRILLSLKRVVGSGHQPRTYLFDEVDSGVSGTTAEKVGKKLRSIAKGQQVICITHLPQVAASGDSHFYIQKSPKKGNVMMEVVELAKKDRIHELARLISGEKITKTSLAHAEQLLSEAH